MANSKRNLSGKWSDPLTSANITDPGQKERNKNGFPHNDSSAAGIFRKKFLDYLSTVKVEGGADLTQSLREAREGLTKMIMDVATAYQVTDHIALIVGSAFYESDVFMTKGIKLRATNQFIQGVYSSYLSEEKDVQNISTGDARKMGAEQTLGLITALSEAICQVNARNEGKSSFVQSEGYIGSKKNKNAEFLASLKEAFTELIKANSARYYFVKLAAIEKHNLPTLSRILQSTVCPPFGPKDFAPTDVDDVTEKRNEFFKRTDEYYSKCFDDAVDAMLNAMQEEKSRVEDEDDDFYTIFDGDFSLGYLFSEESAKQTKDYESANGSFHAIMMAFEEFINNSSEKFKARGTQYFDSQLKYFNTEGGLDSNLAMTNYSMILVEVMAEAGIFLGNKDVMTESTSAYDYIKNAFAHLKLPDIESTFRSSIDLENEEEFSESRFFETMNVTDVEDIDSETGVGRFESIVTHLREMSDSDLFDSFELNKISIVIEGSNSSENEQIVKEGKELKSVEPKMTQKAEKDHDEASKDTDNDEDFKALSEIVKDDNEKLTPDQQKRFLNLKKKRDGSNQPEDLSVTPKHWVDSGVFKDPTTIWRYFSCFNDSVILSNRVTFDIAVEIFCDFRLGFDKDAEMDMEKLLNILKSRPKIHFQLNEVFENMIFMNLLNFNKKEKKIINSVVYRKVELDWKNLDLNVYFNAMIMSLKDSVWSTFNLSKELDEQELGVINSKFKVVEQMLKGFQHLKKVPTQSHKDSLIRTAFKQFFEESDPKSDPISGIVLKGNLKDLPLETDLSGKDFTDLTQISPIKSKTMREKCEKLNSDLRCELEKLKRESLEKKVPGLDLKTKKNLFPHKYKPNSTNPKSSEVQRMLVKHSLKILDYQNTGMNCLFHSINIIQGSKKEPIQMRKDVCKEVSGTTKYDEYFTKDGKESNDPLFKSKKQWLKDMEKETTYGDQIAMSVMMDLIDREIEVFHTDDYSVKYNSGRQTSTKHLLCENSNHFYPVEVNKLTSLGVSDLEGNLKEMEFYMAINQEIEKPDEKKEEKKKGPDASYKADFKKLLSLEVKVCQPSWKNSGLHRNMRMGNFSYKPVIKGKIGTEGQADEDIEVEFVNLTGKETFRGTLSYVVNYLIKYETGCTLGNGELQNDYAYINDENTCYDLVDAALTHFNEELTKGGWKNGVKGEQKEDEPANDGNKGKEGKQKRTQGVSSVKKMCFSTDVIFVDQKTYMRTLIAIVNSISKYFNRQTLDFENFELDSIDWCQKRKNTGIPERHWNNLGNMLKRNMRKSFVDEDLYMYPLLPRRNLIVGTVGSGVLMSTELSFMMNGGPPEEAFFRLCELTVLCCKADIPEKSVHSIHQYLLNSLDRSKFLSNKTSFVMDLWSKVVFSQNDDNLKGEFNKGKPKK